MLRIEPGAMSNAINAASMGKVPDPHMGSTNGDAAFQPDSRIIPAASTSLKGASTVSRR